MLFDVKHVALFQVCLIIGLDPEEGSIGKVHT